MSRNEATDNTVSSPNNVYASIDVLVDYAGKHLDLDPRDADWTRNRIFELFELDSYRPTGETTDDTAPDELLSRFRESCVAAGLFEPEEGPKYADVVMGLLSASPSAVQDRFVAVEQSNDGMEAMRWLYDYSVANNYVKKAVLDKNPRFDSHGVTVTINLAKPEFKNMKKAAAGNSVAGGYPSCTICHENEGFAGRDKRTLRTVPVTLGGEPWFWQFSPYGYFHQHGICVNTEHTPMHVDRDTFGHLLDFVDQLAQLEDALAEGRPLPESVSEFTLEWDELTAALNDNRDRAAIHQAVHEELGSVCERILGNTAVFKIKEQTVAFLAALGFTQQ